MKHLSIRTNLLWGFWLVVTIIFLCATFIGSFLISKSIVPVIQDKVRFDLNTTRVILQKSVFHVSEVTRLIGENYTFISALEGNDKDGLVSVMDALRQKENLDVLTITDMEGNVIIRARNPEHKGKFLNSRAMLEEVLEQGSTMASIEVLSAQELAGEGPAMAVRAAIKISPTVHSRQKKKDVETSGMCIIAGCPIINQQDLALGILWGGQLLNNSFDVVETVESTISENQKYKGRSVCAATIFLKDVRISTNIKKDNGQSAIGTLVSEEVYDKVFIRGETWLRRAFEVNDWYIKAYEPIKNFAGNTIGILGLGMLENKFKDMQEDALLNFLLVVIGGIALSTVIGSLLIQRIMNPINSMVKATENIASGDFKATVDPDRFPEEIATLGKAFNRMASAIEERDRQLRRQSQEEIRRSEKFAMIGRLAAGVAHEINNPLGSIMLFSRLLLRKAPSGGLQQENLKRIEKETRRCQVIVQGLLDFARRREPEFEDININDVVDKTIDLFANNPMLHNILIARETRPDLPRISVDPAQIMQVFTNILMNAVDGMDGRGTITIKTSFSASTKDIEVSFSDTGDGIADEMIEKIFEPFYTTKSVGQGTGLGLSVSLGIVEKHGGTIKVHSRLGEGATFVVVLPVCRESD